ncbi:MAG: GNAT family N-acetyltransferase [Defluviitaleaceae bacterium]|nr:GNAT family N-acetyltransferase [Defluviitaleaceae bacterium]
MIRKLTEKDHEKVISLVEPKASINLFIIGDIEMYGYDKDFQELWGDFNDDHLRGILLRYYDSFIVYGLEGYDAKGFAEIIENYEIHDVVSGEQNILKDIESLLKGNYNNKATYFAECRKETLQTIGNEELYTKVNRASPEDARGIAELAYSIEEFASTIKSVDEQTVRVAKKIKDKAGRVYFIKDDGKVVSMVQTAAENSKSAMLASICTDPKYRMKGYTTAIMSIMLQDLFEKKETVCLFYDNPKAGSIYKRSGFYDIGMWTMLVKEK